MSAPTLKIAYSDTAKDLVLHDGDGNTQTVTKATDANTPTQANLGRGFLLGDELRAAVKAGTVAFVTPVSPSAEEQQLAVEVLRALVRGLGPEFLTSGKRMKDGESALEQQRDAYNANHQQVKAFIAEGNTLAAGAKKLADATVNLLVPKAEQAAVTAATAALAAKDAEFLALANGPGTITQEQLDTFNTERKQLEDDLAAAQARLAAATQSLQDEFGAVRTALGETATLMKDLQASHIGTELTWKWPPTP